MAPCARLRCGQVSVCAGLPRRIRGGRRAKRLFWRIFLEQGREYFV